MDPTLLVAIVAGVLSLAGVVVQVRARVVIERDAAAAKHQREEDVESARKQKDILDGWIALVKEYREKAAACDAEREKDRLEIDALRKEVSGLRDLVRGK